LKNEELLTPRWTLLRHHPAGIRYSNSPHRFNTVAAGRRSGKTERAKRKLVKKALWATTPWAPRFFAAAPTRDQAKRIFWSDLKLLTPRRYLASKPSESDLMIEYITGAQIWVIGMDKPQRLEGPPWDGGVLDEYANMRESAWGANVRPALSDRMGWCDLIGVPEGRNHYYKTDREARAQMKALGRESEWGSYSWPSSDILPPSEIESAKRDLDKLTYQQEYEASWISFEGRTYYPFMEDTHCAPLKYDPRAPLIFTFDFNVDPGVAAVIQEQALPGQFEEIRSPAGIIARQQVVGTGVIGEVWIERNSNTPAVCRKLIADWGREGKNHQGRVICYGDATGGARGTAKVEGSDWELIEKVLRPEFKTKLTINVKDSNPKERSRINAVNSRIQSVAGVRRLMVDGRAAPHVVQDFEGVMNLKGGSGEIDKKKSPMLSHISDSIGYYVEYEFPTVSQQVQRVEIGGV
jgi:hypothetical protein